jgi:hypothetical protein
MRESFRVYGLGFMAIREGGSARLRTVAVGVVAVAVGSESVAIRGCPCRDEFAIDEDILRFEDGRRFPSR